MYSHEKHSPMDNCMVGGLEPVIDTQTVEALPELCSVADFEKRRVAFQDKNHAGQTIRACACGNRSFHLIAGINNIKATCTYCGNMDIIAWFPGANDSSAGAVLDFSTGKWRYCAQETLILQDKVHRRNLQIADLKEQLEQAKRK